jgi:hypothetical protein
MRERWARLDLLSASRSNARSLLISHDCKFMSAKAVLFDLENNMPTAKMLRDLVEHYPTLYLFNCKGQFTYSLEDLTEFATWVSSGQVVILETAQAKEKEFEYAVLVGQLIALLEPDTHVEVISAAKSSVLLIELMQSSSLSCSLIQIQDAAEISKPKYKIPSLDVIQSKPYLKMVKQYCDALAKMSGKPNTVDSLKNSVMNILHVVPEKAQHVVGMLINLKIVKRYDEQINFRKKVLKQWAQLHLAQDQAELETSLNLDQAVEQLQTAAEQSCSAPETQHAQEALFKDFGKIDPVQLQVAKKLRELKNDKPKDIYALRDLLEQMFPKADIRLLLKELIEKGYIYWNGHEVLYSHEMFLN